MRDLKDIPDNEKVSNTPLRTEDLERHDVVSHTSGRDQNKKRMGAIQAFFDKLKPVRGVAMTQEEYAAYKGRDVSGQDDSGLDELGPDDPELDELGPDGSEPNMEEYKEDRVRHNMEEYKEDRVRHNMEEYKEDRVRQSVEEFEKARVRQSMEEYEEEWVDRFVQSKNVGERQHLMDELQERKILHEHEEAYVEDFVNERDPDKREVLVNNIREKHSAYDEYVRRSAYSPQSAHLSSADIDDLSTHQEAFVEDFVNERDPDKREMLVNNLQEKQSAYNESVSRPVHDADSLKLSAVQLSSDDIADLSTAEPSHQL